MRYCFTLRIAGVFEAHCKDRELLLYVHIYMTKTNASCLMMRVPLLLFPGEAKQMKEK